MTSGVASSYLENPEDRPAELPADAAEARQFGSSRGRSQPMIQPESSQTGARLLVPRLEAQGVPFVFGIPGGAVTPILEALADGGPQFVTLRHETAGAFMAQAYGCCTTRGSWWRTGMGGWRAASHQSAKICLEGRGAPGTIRTGTPRFGC
jgi:hypothetical protein